MDYKVFEKHLRMTADDLKNLEKDLLNGTEKIVTDYTRQAFKKEQWDGKQWDKRKRVTSRHDRKNKDKPRALLVKSGNLRRSVEVVQRGTQIIISSDMPYAKIQNEGGTINHPGGTPYIMDKETGKPKFVSKKRADSMANRKRSVKLPVTKAHQITIPKRQFIGESKELEQKIENMIVKKIKEAFLK